MEHNFNPNKGDYKYILEEEERKKTGAATPPPVLKKQKQYYFFLTWIIVRLLKRSKRTDQIKISIPILFEFFY
jgi:hypothetical protein